MGCCLSKPMKRLRSVRRHTFTGGVHQTELELAARISIDGQLSKTGERCRKVSTLFSSYSVFILATQNRVARQQER